MNKLSLDFETKSEVDLTKVGAWAYASHPSTDIICMGWAIEDKKVQVIRRANLLKGNLFTYGQNMIVAHNVQFEYAIYHFIMHKRYGWPALVEPKFWDCTMARALTCGLPPSLEGVALALKLPFQKDLEGRSALLKICKPDPRTGKFNEDPALYEKVYAYNSIDVEVERVADHALPELTPEERKVFELDLVMNRRGIAIDVRSCQSAQKVAGELTKNLNQKLYDMTGGAVDGATKIASMKMWVAAQGVPIPTKPSKKLDDTGLPLDKETLDKEAVGDLFNDPATPQHVKDVLSVRQQVGKSSVSKFKKMLECVCVDERIRGTLQYHGAHTGRAAGRLIQPQNYPQGLVGAEQEQAISLLAEGPEVFKAVYDGKSMQTLSDSLRGMLVPGEGKTFLSADYNAIEARVLFWLAGETGALAQYARGESPYVSLARLIYGNDAITKATHPKEYDIGKRSILGFGFGMGWVRFQATVYTETAKTGTPVELSDAMSEKACKTYRGLYSRVVEFWYAMEAAAVNAALNPGQIFSVADGRVAWGMSKDRKFLVCRLPSGRLLRYFRPEVRTEEDRFQRMKNVLYYWTAAGEGALKTECNGLLGMYRTWGGELVENVVQAAARDIMVNGMLNVEAKGFPLVLTVHDELLAEVQSQYVKYSGLRINEKEAVPMIVDVFTKLMCELPAWARGCPIAAEGWVGKRYRK